LNRISTLPPVAAWFSIGMDTLPQEIPSCEAGGRVFSTREWLMVREKGKNWFEADADFAEAIDGVAGSVCRSKGQKCSACSPGIVGSWASPATPGPTTFRVCTSLHEFLSEKGQRWEAVMEAGATNGFGRIGRLIVRTGRATFSMSVDSHLYWRG